MAHPAQSSHHPHRVVTLLRAPAAPGRYRVHIRATSNGRIATDTSTLLVTPPLKGSGTRSGCSSRYTGAPVAAPSVAPRDVGSGFRVRRGTIAKRTSSSSRRISRGEARAVGVKLEHHHAIASSVGTIAGDGSKLIGALVGAIVVFVVLGSRRLLIPALH